MRAIPLKSVVNLLHKTLFLPLPQACVPQAVFLNLCSYPLYFWDKLVKTFTFNYLTYHIHTDNSKTSTSSSRLFGEVQICLPNDLLEHSSWMSHKYS